MFIKNVLSNLNSILVRLVKEIRLYSDVGWVCFNSEHLCLLSWCYSLNPMWRWPQLDFQHFGSIEVRRVKLRLQCFKVSPRVGLVDFMTEKQTSTWEQWNWAFFPNMNFGFSRENWWDAPSSRHAWLLTMALESLPSCLLTKWKKSTTVVLPCTRSALKSVATLPLWYRLWIRFAALVPSLAWLSSCWVLILGTVEKWIFRCSWLLMLFRT